jgi:hypothetical protein
MIMTRICVAVLIGLLVIGDAAAQDASRPPVLDSRDAPRPGSTPAGLAPTPTILAADRVPSPNPLWAIPLTQLTVTRERPLFSASRRPPPAVIAKAAPAPAGPPPKPKEPDKPPLVLVGTVTGEGEAIGLFANPADRSVVRLKTGEDHKGWMLRTVQPRQAVLAKGPQIAVLELPRHEVSKAGSAPPPAAPDNRAPELPPVAPENRAPEPADDKIAAPASSPIDPIDTSSLNVFSPIDSPKKNGGFKPPAATAGPSAVATIILQPPVITLPPPPVNPFRNARLP